MDLLKSGMDLWCERFLPAGMRISVVGRVLSGLLLGGFLVLPCVAQMGDRGLDSLTESAEAYLAMLAHLDRKTPWSDSASVFRHLAQLALLLPDELERKVADGDLLEAPHEARLRAGAGMLLQSWWHRQDPLPASPINERLLEHMKRVQYAEKHFATDRRATAFDDRGMIHVLYGRPEREVRIRFDEPEFTDKIYEFGVVVNRSDFADNEFWRYGHIDGTANYLFLKRDGQYRIAGTTELLPRSLRTGFTAARRGPQRAEMTLATMRTIYRQLAAEAPTYLNRFSMVDNYLSALEAPGRVAARVLGESFRSAILDQDDDTELQPGGRERSAGEMVQSTISLFKVEDAQMAYQRELLMPPTYSEVHRTLPQLAMGVRAARFLDADATTRTELYWGPEPGALRNANRSEAFALHLTTVQMGPGYDRRNIVARSIQITDLPSGSNAVIPVQQTVVRGDTGLYHVALQWDLHRVIRAPGEQYSAGERLRVGVRHVDSLSALNGSGTTLEMSDLKPITMVPHAESGGRLVPYPYRQVAADTPLGLYFEVYHLRFGEGDSTRYSVTYRIAHRMDVDRPHAPTSVTTTHTGTQSAAHQEMLLDLSDWNAVGPVTITVTVRDLTIRRNVVRSIDFDLF